MYVKAMQVWEVILVEWFPPSLSHHHVHPQLLYHDNPRQWTTTRKTHPPLTSINQHQAMGPNYVACTTKKKLFVDAPLSTWIPSMSLSALCCHLPWHHLHTTNFCHCPICIPISLGQSFFWYLALPNAVFLSLRSEGVPDRMLWCIHLVKSHLFVQRICPVIESEHVNELSNHIGIRWYLSAYNQKDPHFFMIGYGCRDVGVENEAIFLIVFSWMNWSFCSGWESMSSIQIPLAHWLLCNLVLSPWEWHKNALQYCFWSFLLRMSQLPS